MSEIGINRRSAVEDAAGGVGVEGGADGTAGTAGGAVDDGAEEDVGQTVYEGVSHGDYAGVDDARVGTVDAYAPGSQLVCQTACEIGQHQFTASVGCESPVVFDGTLLPVGAAADDVTCHRSGEYYCRALLHLWQQQAGQQSRGDVVCLRCRFKSVGRQVYTAGHGAGVVEKYRYFYVVGGAAAGEFPH